MVDNIKSVEIKIDGMMSSHCQNKVKDTIKSHKDVKAVLVNLEDGFARVDYIGNKVNIPSLVESITKLGYPAEQIRE